uniref:Uncharacterized protein n=1 Tax=Arundo donax TaxID=35708 RepID=A0A0A9D7I3_ARUDO
MCDQPQVLLALAELKMRTLTHDHFTALISFSNYHRLEIIFSHS